MDLQPHPIALEFPPLLPDELQALANNIRQRGLLTPIVLHSGQILDGWHRYQACITEGVEPTFVEYAGSDPIGEAMALNFHRRHLTVADRKRIARKLLEEQPSRTNRSIAKVTGVSHTTVNEVRRDIEAEAHHVEPSTIEPSTVEPTVMEEMAITLDIPPELLPRVESTGRKARGRKPKTAAERAAPPKEIKPKRLVSPRDEWIVACSSHLSSDLGRTLEDLVACVKDCEGKIREKLSERQRRFLAERFIAALGFALPEGW